MVLGISEKDYVLFEFLSYLNKKALSFFLINLKSSSFKNMWITLTRSIWYFILMDLAKKYFCGFPSSSRRVSTLAFNCFQLAGFKRIMIDRWRIFENGFLFKNGKSNILYKLLDFDNFSVFKSRIGIDSLFYPSCSWHVLPLLIFVLNYNYDYRLVLLSAKFYLFKADNRNFTNCEMFILSMKSIYC